jgi:ankyrin repeat protein
MDPMEAAEAEIIRKEEEELNDVREAIGLEDFLSKRDFSDRGRDVVTSGKQWQQVQTIAKSLHLREYRSIQASANKKLRGRDDDASPVVEFNLLDKRRVLLREGAANKREPDGKLWKTSRKYLFLFNDLILICSKRERKSPDEFDLQEVIGMNELRVVNLAFDENEDPAALELAASRRGQRVREGTILSFSSEAEKSEWMREIVNTSFAYHLSNKTFARQLGWHHEIVQGTAHSAAYLGDAALLRKVLRTMDRRGETIDIHDDAGMCPIHWAVLRGHEACVRILLDKGADIDVMNTGLNTPLLLAVCKGYDSIARLLLDKGADLFVRNLVDKDCVMMAVLFGHSSKGLPWVLQLLNSRGLDLNQFDANGATPLHMCASKNLPRPVRMLVDAGADVNCLHQRTQLTPLQMACSHARPDVETIRSFLDKGAYVNWRDLQGRTAFDIVLQSCRPAVGADGGAGSASGTGASGASISKSSDDFDTTRESFAMLAGAGGTQQKYANMDVTLTRVSDYTDYYI